MPISNLVPEEPKDNTEDPKEQPSSVVSDDKSPSSTEPVVQTAQSQEPSETTPNTNTKDGPTGAPAAPTAVVVEEKSQYDKITDALIDRIGGVGAKSTFKLCIYGPPGGAKSSLLSQIPGLLGYDLEDGVISMATQEAFTNKPRASGQNIMPFKSFKEADLLVERLESNSAAFAQWPVFAMDTFSDFYKRALEEEVKRRWERLPESLRQITSQYGNEKDDYSPVNGLMLHFVRKLRNMEKDLVIIAHARTVEPRGMPAKTFPDFSESLANKIESMMDVVAYMEMMQLDDGTEAPVMRTKSDGRIHAKSRIPLPTLIVNPDWPSMKAVWTEWKEKAEAENQ